MGRNKTRWVLAAYALGFIGLASRSPVLCRADDPKAGRPAERDRPNILFIITDQQHTDMMSCAGNPHLQTPAMDSLAEGGIRFTNAYVANPVCVPSRISMATGIMPGRLGVFNNGMKAVIPAGDRCQLVGQAGQARRLRHVLRRQGPHVSRNYSP